MPLPIKESRAAILARMVSKAPERKLGRTQVMKLFYFLQELKGIPLGYDFRLFTYGPFDSEVLSDLATACCVDTVSEKTVIYPRGYGYEITPGPLAERLQNDLARTDLGLTAQVDEVVREFGSLGAAELELRSTILFVDRELGRAGTTVTARDVSARVHQIKPHFDQPAILNRIAEMKVKGWLECLPEQANTPIPF